MLHNIGCYSFAGTSNIPPDYQGEFEVKVGGGEVRVVLILGVSAL